MKDHTKIIKVLCSVLIAASMSLYVSSCKKDNNNSSSTTVTEADAAELTTDAVTPANAGMVTDLSSSTNIYSTVPLSCGEQKDSTIVRASATGASPSYNYTLSWAYVLTCNGKVPAQLALNFTGSGSYNGPRMSSTDNSTGAFILTGLQTSSSQYTMGGTYTRKGTAISKIGNQNTFTNTLTITGANIAVDKTSQQIVSGTATVNFTAVSTSGKTFTYNGTITFLGGKKATLILNSGASYSIQWV